MGNKQYITAQQLLDDSFQVGLQIIESGYRPNYIVGVWRGGAPVGIAVQELLDFVGIETDHIAIRTSSYTGIDQRDKTVRVHGLNYIVNHVNAEDSLLIVDDVHDTGSSIEQVIKDIEKYCRKNTPEIKVATPYFKPNRNKTQRKPDFFVHETEDWLVFPHELSGLTAAEIGDEKPGIDAIKKLLAQHFKQEK